jgi:hypothetical protein
MIMSPSQPLVIPGDHDVFQNFSISTNPKSLILASAWIRSAPSRSPEFLQYLTVIRSKALHIDLIDVILVEPWCLGALCSLRILEVRVLFQRNPEE